MGVMYSNNMITKNIQKQRILQLKMNEGKKIKNKKSLLNYGDVSFIEFKLKIWMLLTHTHGQCSIDN
jgi:hypothetical protein